MLGKIAIMTEKKLQSIVLIPAYQPGEALLQSTQALLSTGLIIVVVDDGSGADYAHIFNRLDGQVQRFDMKKMRKRFFSSKQLQLFRGTNLPNYVSLLLMLTASINRWIFKACCRIRGVYGARAYCWARGHLVAMMCRCRMV